MYVVLTCRRSYFEVEGDDIVLVNVRKSDDMIAALKFNVYVEFAAENRVLNQQALLQAIRVHS